MVVVCRSILLFCCAKRTEQKKEKKKKRQYKISDILHTVPYFNTFTLHTATDTHYTHIRYIHTYSHENVNCQRNCDKEKKKYVSREGTYNLTHLNYQLLLRLHFVEQIVQTDKFNR